MGRRLIVGTIRGCPTVQARPNQREIGSHRSHSAVPEMPYGLHMIHSWT